jgi:DNA helicase IV
MAAHPELATEQEHLEEVLGLLDRTIEQGASMGDAGVSRRDTTRLAIRHEARRKELEGARDQVYFGKLQHEQRGPLYIGRMAIMDGESRARVISWRTPAARAYYEATADRPMGCTLRRSLDVRGRTVRSLRDEQFDGRVVAPATPPGPVTRPLESVAASEPEVAPQPEPAPPSARKAPTPPDRSHRPAPERRPEQREEPPVERARPAAPEPQSAAVPGPATEPAVAHPPAADSVLAEFERARGDAMHDIVASIQADQYRLIREEREGVLVIQGGPGTGKTAVALHRAAWLLFHHQEELVRSRVLVVGPNRAFMDYVAEVLPSLGESAVEQRPIGGLVHASITGEPERHAVRRLKGDPRMVGLLDRAVRNFVRLPRRPIDVDTGSERVRLAPELLRDVYEEALAGTGTLVAARIAFLDRVVTRAIGQHLTERPGKNAEARRSQLVERLRGSRQLRSLMRSAWPRTDAEQFLNGLFANERRLTAAANGELTPPEVHLLVRSEGALTESDVALLDELQARIEGRPDSFGYVLVDEAQDLTPMQLRMVARRARGGMTLVGDIAQATGPWPHRSWQGVVAHLDADGDARVGELTLGYRVPRQVMDVAVGLLDQIAGGVTAPLAVREGDADPYAKRCRAEDLERVVADEVAALHVDEAQKVAVIASEALVGPLRASMATAGITAGDVRKDGLRRTVTLLTAERAKGLEFDDVVVVEPQSIVEEGRHGAAGLYVALTRATQRLAVVHSRGLVPGMGRLPETVVGPPDVKRAPVAGEALSGRFSEALLLAKLVTDGRTHPMTGAPHLAHLLATAALVLEDGGDEHQAVAALLHDVAGAHERLPDDLAAAVSATTRWSGAGVERRLGEDLEGIAAADARTQRTLIAVTLEDATTLVRSLREVGRQAWSACEGAPDEVVADARALAELFERERPGTLVRELRSSVEELAALAGHTRQDDPASSEPSQIGHVVPAAAPSAGPAGHVVREWITRLLGSPAFTAHRERLARTAIADGDLTAILDALAAHGGRLSLSGLRGRVDVSANRLQGLLAALRPLLNREGEPVLTIDEAADAVTLDIPLLGEVYELEIGYNA